MSVVYLGRVTVVHEGKCVGAGQFDKLFEGNPRRHYIVWSSNGDFGVIDPNDEGIRWVHGSLFSWWPPHRKKMNALLTASSLAGPVKVPPRVAFIPRLTVSSLLPKLPKLPKLPGMKTTTTVIVNGMVVRRTETTE